MKKVFLVYFIAVAFSSFVFISESSSYNQPTLNPGVSNFLDGFVPGPGFYVVSHLHYYTADELRDSNGDEIPGSPDLAVMSEITQLVYLTDYKLLGGKVGFESILPFSNVDIDGVGEESGFGDLFVAPFLQFETKLFDTIPYHHRFLFGVVLPTGRYDCYRPVNIGHNHYTFTGYYAFTAFLTPKMATSWRFQYFHHTENKDFLSTRVDLKPGPLFQASYAFSYEILQGLRTGISGYYYKQLSEDELNGDKISGSKEQIFSIGPGIFYGKGNVCLWLNAQWEFEAECRSQGKSIFGKIMFKF